VPVQVPVPVPERFSQRGRKRTYAGDEWDVE